MSNHLRFILAVLVIMAWPAFGQEPTAGTAAGTTAAPAALYWEPLREVARGSAASLLSNLQVAAGGGVLAAAWQERVIDPRDSLGGQLRAWVTVSRDGLAWTQPQAIGAPVPLSGVQQGREPPITAIAVDGDGRIVVGVLGQDDRVTLSMSTDRGATFSQVDRLGVGGAATSLALSVTREGRFLLLVARTRESAAGAAPVEGAAAIGGRIAVAYSVSAAGGGGWSPMTDLSDPSLSFSFQQQHAIIGDRDYVVFSSRYELGGAFKYQLYLAWSTDGGLTWNPAVAVTTGPAFREAVAGQPRNPTEFNNFRPSIADVGGKAEPARVGLAWERQSPSGSQRQIYYCELDRDGLVVTPLQKVSSATGGGRFARLFAWDGVPWLGYIEQTDRSRLVLAARRQLWEPDTAVSLRSDGADFPQVGMLADHPYLFWERGGSVVRLSPDISTLPPVLAAKGFTPGQPSNRSAVSVAVDPPQDASGLAELRYQWGPEGATLAEVTAAAASQTLQLEADADGTWVLSVRAVDRAGNVSSSATVSYVRDTVPPPAVALALDPAPDADGYLPSNTYTVRWAPPAGKAVRGYVVVQLTLADDPAAAVVPPAVGMAGRPLQDTRALGAANADNGVRAIVVAAQDVAGNFSEPSTLVLRLRRYVPVTYISRLSSTRDEQEDMLYTIVGRGFAVGGKIQQIYLDRDRREPWDHVFTPGQFTVIDDRHIQGPTLDVTIDSGTYWIGVRHPVRPVAWSAGAVTWDSPGTVKFGSFEFRWAPRWVLEGTARLVDHVLPFSSVVLVLVLAMMVVVAAFAGQRMVVVAREGVAFRAEAVALLEGHPSPALAAEREKTMKELRRRGAGLRLKFSLLMIVLVAAIVAIVAAGIAIRMIPREQKILATGLQDRVNMLMQEAADRAAEQIPNGVDLGAANMVEVPTGTKTMPDEALSLIVTGPLAGKKVAEPPEADRDYVWAATQDAGPWKQDYEQGTFQPGTMAVDDEVAREIAVEPTYAHEVNAAVQENEVLRGNIDIYWRTQARLTALGSTLGMKAAADPDYKTMNDLLKKLRLDINQGLRDVALAKVGSVPTFDAAAQRLQPNYLFYRPIMVMASTTVGDQYKASPYYYTGLVRVEISTANVQRQIDQATSQLLTTTLLAALVALGMGILGAIILASITIRPIKQLVKGVGVIRDTEDKEQLKNHVIEVRSRDEIGTLADTVNEMTQGLAKAAAANKALILGRDVQKMFLPLDKDRAGRKGSTFGLDTKELEIYGYYEGAAEVSGDFFDFRQLDATHHAFIKCDVSGHGVSAGLIMVEVATLYINWSREWQRTKEGLAQVKDPGERQRIQRDLTRLDTLVYTINDMIEERGFTGLFAAFTLGIVDTSTWTITACPAGDNEVMIYDVSEGRIVHSQFTAGDGSPAAGAVASMLVEMKSGFPQFPIRLDHGDVLFLPTDGIDEAKRRIRSAAFEVVKVEEGPNQGEDRTEDFGKTRMDSFITGVFSRGRVNLVREDNPIPDEQLDFDFSSCEGTMREAVLAVISAEKLFRLALAPTAGEGDKVAVDAKVDAFLKKHFVQYERYFAHRLEGQPDDAYVRFSHLVEDEQRDDLTILVVRRK